MDDAALVAAARAGDREAWGRIYDRYADKLHDHCWAILRDEHEAGDALHDAFVKAAGAIGQLRDPSRLRPWLYAITRNEAFRRHRARARVVPTDDIGELSEVNVDLGGEAGPSVEDLRQLVWDASGGLSEDDKALLDLHLRQGLEGEELAEAMGITPNNAYVKLSRLRDTLERSLGALLVARTARRDCEELAALLSDWDGALSPLLRKRIARHIDSCEVCEDRKKAVVSPLALLAGVPVLRAPAALRDRILDDAVAASSASSSGGPAAPRVWARVLGAAAAVAVVVGALVFTVGGDDSSDTVQIAAEAGTSTTAAATATSATVASTTSTTVAASTTTTVAIAAPGVFSLSRDTIAVGESFRIHNDGDVTISYTLVPADPRLHVSPATGTIEPGQRRTVTPGYDSAGAPEGPFSTSLTVDAAAAGRATVTVTGTVAPRPPVIGSVSASESSVNLTCASAGPYTATVTAAFTDDSATTAELVVTGPGAVTPTRTTMTAAGTGATGQIGPFGGSTGGTAQFHVVVTDAHGASTTSPTQSIDVVPCPG